MVIATFDVAGIWDSNADAWARDIRSGRDTYREIFTFPAFLEFLPSLDGQRIIDLGCGEGTNTRHFAELGATVTGVDLSPKMIALAAESQRSDPKVDFRVASYTDLTCFPEGSFDAAISTLAFMDGKEIEAAMSEAHRIIRPGGFLAFSILHPCGVTAVRPAEDKISSPSSFRYHYFDRQPFEESWSFPSEDRGNRKPGFSVARFPRTVADYINAVADAGFRIERVDEPVPSSLACEIDSRLRRWLDFPFLLFILATRP